MKSRTNSRAPPPTTARPGKPVSLFSTESLRRCGGFFRFRIPLFVFLRRRACGGRPATSLPRRVFALAAGVRIASFKKVKSFSPETGDVRPTGCEEDASPYMRHPERVAVSGPRGKRAGGRGLSKAVFGSGGNGGDSARAGVLKEGGADRERGKPLGERFPRSRVPPYCSSNEARFLLMTETRSGMICAISSMLPEQAASSRHRAGSSSTRRS